jgi:hypothetical protein
MMCRISTSFFSMPPALVKAHNELDKAVDLAYHPQPFTSDANRMEFFFELYEKYTTGLFAVEKKTKSGKGKKSIQLSNGEKRIR